MWNAFFCVGLMQINFSLEKTTINSIKNISAEDGRNWAAAWPRPIAAVTAILMLVWRLPLLWWPRKWPMQSKQLRRRKKLNNQLSKSKKMAAKTTVEVVWRPSAEEGNVAMVAAAAKAMAEGGGVMAR